MDQPHLIVIFGATGDLARRKLLPGLMHLVQSRTGAGLAHHRGLAGRASTTPASGPIAAEACREFSTRPVLDEELADFTARLSYVNVTAGPEALAQEAAKQEAALGGQHGRLHYLSVPPKAALDVVRTLAAAGLVQGSRIIMEKPFGTDLASARALERVDPRGVRREPDLSHRPLPGQGGGAQHPGLPVRERSVRADLEPQLHRPRADRRPRDVVAGGPGRLLRGHGRLQGHGRDPPVPGHGLHGDGTADVAGLRLDLGGEEQGLPVDAAAGSA